MAPSPESGWYTKCAVSAVLVESVIQQPPPMTAKFPVAYVAPVPEGGVPKSRSDQGTGSVVAPPASTISVAVVVCDNAPLTPVMVNE